MRPRHAVFVLAILAAVALAGCDHKQDGADGDGGGGPYLLDSGHQDLARAAMETVLGAQPDLRSSHGFTPASPSGKDA